MAPHSSRPAYDNCLPHRPTHTYTLTFLHMYVLSPPFTHTHTLSLRLVRIVVLVWPAGLSLSRSASLSCARVFALPLLLRLAATADAVVILVVEYNSFSYFFWIGVFLFCFSRLFCIYFWPRHTANNFRHFFSFNDVTWPYSPSTMMSTAVFAANRVARCFTKYVWSTLLLFLCVFRFVVNVKLTRRNSINIYTRMDFLFVDKLYCWARDSKQKQTKDTH